MASQNANTQNFRPLAKMQVQAVTSTAATVKLNYNEKKDRVIRIAVEGTEGVFILFCTPSATVVGDDSISVATATNATLLMLEQTVEAFTLPAGVSQLSVISTAASGSTIYTTIGEGL